MGDGSLLLDVCLSQQEQWMEVDSYGIWLAGCVSLSRQIDGWNGGEESPQAWWLKLDKTRLLSLFLTGKRLRVFVFAKAKLFHKRHEAKIANYMEFYRVHPLWVLKIKRP